jgi:Fe-S-cluster containining protein
MDELALDHPRFRTVTAALFTRRLTPDCMVHQCEIVADEHAELADPRARIDACCQYGCDVDLAERDAILARRDGIRALLDPEAAAAPWFEDDVWSDADYPSGRVVRTTVGRKGCIFLSHDQRGCAIHRAALENGWGLGGVKPAVCRLYPVTWEGDAIVIAGEYPEYSCAHTDGPTLYQLARDLLSEIFGPELVEALDAAEARVLAEVRASGTPPAGPRRLPLVRS